jgi:hypothetical protein
MPVAQLAQRLLAASFFASEMESTTVGRDSKNLQSFFSAATA